MIVKISYTTHIPSEAIKLPGTGSGYNGGRKSTLELEIDLSVAGSGSMTLLTRSWGETREYDASDVLDVPGKPSWFKALANNATVQRRGTLALTDDNLSAKFITLPDSSHAVKLIVAGPNPLISGSPDIDGEFVVSFRDNGGHPDYRVYGDHDGFPSHDIYVGGHHVVKHDCVAEEQTPLSLFPPSEFNMLTGWVSL